MLMLEREGDFCAKTCLQILHLNRERLVLCSTRNPIPLWSYGALYNIVVCLWEK